MATDAVSLGAAVGRGQASVGGSRSPFLPNPCREGSCAPRQQEPVHGRPWGPQRAGRQPCTCWCRWLWAVGCRDPTQPQKKQSSWPLADTDGQPLPLLCEMDEANAKGCACSSKHPFEMGFEKNRQHPKHGRITNLGSGSNEVFSSVYYSLPNNI